MVWKRRKILFTGVHLFGRSGLISHQKSIYLSGHACVGADAFRNYPGFAATFV